MLSVMIMKEPRKVVSRRSRPAKAPLSRDAIVTAALDLLTRDGLPGLSLHKVAAALDTGAASLYVYIANLEELQALVLDQALGDVALPTSQEGDWQRRLKEVLTAYFLTLYARPGLAQLAMRTMPIGRNMLRITEALLGLLLEGGLPGPTAAWGVDLLTLYITAIAAEQSASQGNNDALRPVVQAIGAVSAAEYPHIHALRDSLLSGEGAARFDWALAVILSGMVQSAEPPAGFAADPPTV